MNDLLFISVAANATDEVTEDGLEGYVIVQIKIGSKNLKRN